MNFSDGQNFLNLEKNDNSILIENLINSIEFKGIVVYPMAVHWQPLQRPQHILREFCKLGYLCFFIEPNNENLDQGIIYDKKFENLYVIYDSLALLYPLQIYHPIVLCTWIIQLNWIDLLPNKFIWYDILDKPEFFSQYDSEYLRKHNDLLITADFVSYTADNLFEYVSNRKNSILIPNGVNLDDFINNQIIIPDFFNNLNPEHKIIGFFGALGYWIDIEIIIELASNNPNFEIVLIGPIEIDTTELIKYNNIHILGLISHEILSQYASNFDVCIIPFKVNDLTNSVSPVKFFEYTTLGKPIVSTNIFEMRKYACEWVFLASDKYDFNKLVRNALNNEIKNIAKSNSLSIALDNTWTKRLDSMFLSNLNYDFLKCHADLKRNNCVDLYTITFLDFIGYNFFCGGAERYIIDLFQLFKNFNVNFNVFQYGEYSWVRKFNNITVISLNNNSSPLTHSFEEREFYSKNFYNYSSNSILSIYSPFFLKVGFANINNIGISHGVAWDSEYNVNLNAEIFWNLNKQVIDAGKSLNKIISVDTNTSNWFQTIDFATSKKIKTIPNYVDTTIFTPTSKKADIDKLIITFPRRLYAPRGLFVVLNILDSILENYQNVEFHFVGRGFDIDVQHIEDKIKKWGDKIKLYNLLPSEMYTAYNASDIILIPTIYSEGTSLSCLEAMACGNAIIATRVGGLSDLIIDGYNGRLIDLGEENLFNALVELIENKHIREFYASNALAVSKAFDISFWNKRWNDVLNDSIDSKSLSVPIKKHLYIKLYLPIDKVFDINYIYFIKKLLEHGCLVSIKADLCDEYIHSFSYGRLQFENLLNNNILDIADYIVDELDINISNAFKSIHKLLDILNIAY